MDETCDDVNECAMCVMLYLNITGYIPIHAVEKMYLQLVYMDDHTIIDQSFNTTRSGDVAGVRRFPK